MNSKVEVYRTFDSRPSSLLNIISPKNPGFKNATIVDTADELTPLLPEVMDDKTPTNRHFTKLKKDKEMIPASKLASDSTLRGRVLRPAHIFSRIISNESFDGTSIEPDTSRSIMEDGTNSARGETSIK